MGLRSNTDCLQVTGNMDLRNKLPILVFLVACASCVPVNLPVPQNLQVDISDEEVTALWNKPPNAPPDVQYNVQFGRHAGDWTAVHKCTNITETFCDLTDLINDYEAVYKVRVQLEAGYARSEWTLKKKILPNSSKLQPPTFTMWATSTTLTVHINQKPILRKLFPFGITYTIYLEAKGQNKTTITYLEDDTWEHQNEKTFTSLHWRKEYCVIVKVEGNGGLTRGLSPPQCLVLPEQEWIIVAVASLTVAGFLIITAFIATFILCYIKVKKVKTPPALKSPASGWRPLSIGEGPMEIVTDKGWFLFKAETEISRVFKNLPTTYVTDQQSGDDDTRTSTDSGVSMKSTTNPARREDSGCGSLGAQDSICSSNFPIQDEGSDALSAAKTDDSGMGLSCHSDASSLILEEQDSGCLNKSGDYHRQQLLTVCLHESDNENIYKEKHSEPQLVSVVSGYRTNTSLCTCSGANLCIWCHNQSNYKGKCKGQLQNNNVVESYSSYFSNNQIYNMDQTESNLTIAQMEQTFPMLTSLSSFPLMEKGRDLNMNDVSVSLCDVELNS